MKNKEKQLKIKGKNKVEALKDLKSEEQTKAIKNKPEERATIIFNDLIYKRKKILNELYKSVDKNKLYFEYVAPLKDVSFYEYMVSKELFNELKDNHIRFNDALEKQKELLKNINEVKTGGKNSEQEKVVTNLDNFYKSREEVFNFFRDYTKMFFDASYEAKQDETKGTGLKILTPKQMLQRLPIALAQVKAGNNSENLLSKIRQIISSLYQSKEIH